MLLSSCVQCSVTPMLQCSVFSASSVSVFSVQCTPVFSAVTVFSVQCVLCEYNKSMSSYDYVFKCVPVRSVLYRDVCIHRVHEIHGICV